MIAYGLAVAGLDRQIDEVDRVAGPPSFQAIAVLETNFRNAFLNTQARTHVITGSLKASGKTSTDFDGTQWSGTATYGGPSTGPINPVDYAIYEKARGGAHDFYGELYLFDEGYLEGINRHFEG